MEEIIKRRTKLAPLGSPLLFTNRHGNIMTYNQIQESYNRAWKKAGLHPKFSGTHQLRYGCAQISRKIGGSIDATVAMTGYKSIKMADKYSTFDNLDLNKEISEKMNALFSSSSAVEAK